jgi:hypothetical protein
MESWKSEAQSINSRCGFCGMNFDKWQDRIDHLAKEFRNGASMKDWRGCRGLDAHVAAHVTNAMPPYLIANESKSPFPFSATNSASMKVSQRGRSLAALNKLMYHQHHNLYLEQSDLEYLLPSDKISPTGVFIPHNMGDVSMDSSSSVSPTHASFNTHNQTSCSASPHPNPNATCWEILTLRLGRFARQQIEKHGVDSLTDEMLQSKARQILYDSDDAWEQTAADNPEWLSLFKKAHGLDNTTPWPEVIAQHEILEDLGVRSTAQLDKSFDLTNFGDVLKNGSASAAALALECSLAGSMNITKTANAQGTTTPSTLPELGSAASSGICTDMQGCGVYAPISELACTIPGGICIGENGEIGFSVPDRKALRGKQVRTVRFLRMWTKSTVHTLSGDSSVASTCLAVRYWAAPFLDLKQMLTVFVGILCKQHICINKLGTCSRPGNGLYARRRAPLRLYCRYTVYYRWRAHA